MFRFFTKKNLAHIEDKEFIELAEVADKISKIAVGLRETFKYIAKGNLPRTPTQHDQIIEQLEVILKLLHKDAKITKKAIKIEIKRVEID